MSASPTRRGIERSTREPDSELTAEVHADDYHRVIEATRLSPVDAVASSGGAICALHWVVAHPEDVRTLLSHEPPLVALLEDRDMAIKVNADIVDTYQREGFGPAMAKFSRLFLLRGRAEVAHSRVEAVLRREFPQILRCPRREPNEKGGSLMNPMAPPKESPHMRAVLQGHFVTSRIHRPEFISEM